MLAETFVSADMYIEHVGLEDNLNMVYCDGILNIIRDHHFFIEGVKRNEI